jgi:hypothetical protein
LADYLLAGIALKDAEVIKLSQRGEQVRPTATEG